MICAEDHAIGRSVRAIWWALLHFWQYHHLFQVFFYIYDSAESQISLTNWSPLCPVMPHSEIQKKCAWKKKGFHHNHRFPSFLSRQKKRNCTKQKDNFCVTVVGGEAEALSTQRMNVHTDQNYRRMANKCCLVHTAGEIWMNFVTATVFFIKNIPHICINHWMFVNWPMLHGMYAFRFAYEACVCWRQMISISRHCLLDSLPQLDLQQL